MKQIGQVSFPGKEPECWEEITRLSEVNLKILRNVYNLKLCSCLDPFCITIMMLALKCTSFVTTVRSN